jgi:hypothetical protein
MYYMNRSFDIEDPAKLSEHFESNEYDITVSVDSIMYYACSWCSNIPIIELYNKQPTVFL